MTTYINKKKLMDYLSDRVSTHTQLAEHAGKAGNYPRAAELATLATAYSSVQLALIRCEFDTKLGAQDND